MLKTWRLELLERASAIVEPETAFCRGCNGPTPQLEPITDEIFRKSVLDIKLRTLAGQLPGEESDNAFKAVVRRHLGYCSACVELEIALLKSAYWRNLDKVDSLRAKLLGEFGL